MRIVFLSSYVPRKCGLATYTRDLSEELIKQGHDIRIIAMQNNGHELSYGESVKGIIRQEKLADYYAIADSLNKSSLDFVHIQHEFGLYGGEDGEYILDFVKRLTKPIVVTFHTVLHSPSKKQKEIIQELARISRAIIVMEAIAQDRLINVYGVNAQSITTIFHGVPESSKLSQDEAKKFLGFSNKYVILASNLISRNKGYEYVIKALPEIIKSIPHVLFVIVGETHPVVKKQEGESYREELKKLVSTLGVKENVQFINEYIELNKLRKFLAAADICITPYLDPQQITSGTLAYAVGVGKVCISTPYIYAEHLLGKGRGLLVPFHDSEAIANTVSDLYKSPSKRKAIVRKALAFGKEMRWPRVGKKHKMLYKNTLASKNDISWHTRLFLLKNPDLTYFINFTDETGIFQHANFTVPDLRYGYSTDDNGRALIVASHAYKQTKSAKILSLMKTYVKYLQFAQDDEGRFHTFLDYQGKWLDKAAVTDAMGRALWGLGFHLYTCPSSPLFQAVDTMFQKSMSRIKEVLFIHNASYMILGLYYYIKAFKGKKDSVVKATENLIYLADFLLVEFEKHADNQWKWFDNKMTYDIFRIPQALFAAYSITGKKEYKKVALKSLEFAIESNYDKERGYFDFVGQDGWYEKKGKKANFDQQPLEPAGAVGCLVMAYTITQKKKYLQLAFKAFEWYFGNNRNYTVMYDKKSGGVFDGLKPTGINPNEGSENIVCFLIAYFVLKPFVKTFDD